MELLEAGKRVSFVVALCVDFADTYFEDHVRVDKLRI